MKEFKVEREYEAARLDRYVQKSCRDLSKGAIQKLIRTGNIKLNGKKMTGDARLCEGDIVRVYAKTSEFSLRVNESLPKPMIVYEDEFLLAVEKPAGLSVHPGSGKTDCLTERVKVYLKELIISYDGKFIPGTPTRLDTNTSGIVLFAKTPLSASSLAAASSEGKIEKTYTVLVKGKIEKKALLTHYGIKDERENKMKVFDNRVEGSVEMISMLTPINAGEDFSLCEVKLITGRTHQIRCQLAHIGHPVVGDIKYGNSDVNEYLKRECGLSRQFLHCSKVALKLWYDGGSTLTMRSELPEELRRCVGWAMGKGS